MSKVNKMINDFDITNKTEEGLKQFGRDIAKEIILLNEIEQNDAWYNVVKKFNNIPIETSSKESIKIQSEQPNDTKTEIYNLLETVAIGACDSLETMDQRTILIDGISTYSQFDSTHKQIKKISGHSHANQNNAKKNKP